MTNKPKIEKAFEYFNIIKPTTTLHDYSKKKKDGLIPKCELYDNDKYYLGTINSVLLVLEKTENVMVNELKKDNKGVLHDANGNTVIDLDGKQIYVEEIVITTEDEYNTKIEINGKEINNFYELWDASSLKEYSEREEKYIYRKVVRKAAEVVRKAAEVVRIPKTNKKVKITQKNNTTEYGSLLFVKALSVEGGKFDPDMRVVATPIENVNNGGKRKSSRKKKIRRNKKTKIKTRKNRRKSTRRS